MPVVPDAIKDLAISGGQFKEICDESSAIADKLVPSQTAGFEEEYAFGAALGKGAFGSVFVATERSTGQEGAVKILSGADGSRFEQKIMLHEVEIWRTIGNHRNIVELRRSFTEPQAVFIVMEKCQCSVSQLMEKNSPDVHSRMPWLLREMLLGVQVVHKAAVVHRDIKPANFLVSSHGDNIKLCDFGLAIRLPESGGLRGQSGTAPMMSPEMLQGKQYDTATDMWSFGTTAYYMCFCELPYIPQAHNAQAAKIAILQGMPPRWFQGVPRRENKAKVDFLLPLLERQQSERANASQALMHPYLEVWQNMETTSTMETLAPLDDDHLDDVTEDSDEWESEVSIDMDGIDGPI